MSWSGNISHKGFTHAVKSSHPPLTPFPQTNNRYQFETHFLFVFCSNSHYGARLSPPTPSSRICSAKKKKYRKIDVASPASQLIWARMMSFEDHLLLLSLVVCLFLSLHRGFTRCSPRRSARRLPPIHGQLAPGKRGTSRSIKASLAFLFFFILLIGNSAAVCLELTNCSSNNNNQNKKKTTKPDKTMIKLQCNINFITVASVISLCFYFCSYFPVS